MSLVKDGRDGTVTVTLRLTKITLNLSLLWFAPLGEAHLYLPLRYSRIILCMSEGTSHAQVAAPQDRLFHP